MSDSRARLRPPARQVFAESNPGTVDNRWLSIPHQERRELPTKQAVRQCIPEGADIHLLFRAEEGHGPVASRRCQRSGETHRAGTDRLMEERGTVRSHLALS